MRHSIVLIACVALFIPVIAHAFELIDYEGLFVIQQDETNIDDLLQLSAVTTSYSMKVAVTMPKGSAGEMLGTTFPSNTKMTPCSDTSKVDSVTVTLTYNAGKPADKDIYVFFFNPNADGISSPKFYMIKKRTASIEITPRNNAGDIDKLNDIYLTRDKNTGDAITETILGGSVILDFSGSGIPSGTWQGMGIVADSAKIDFDDPATWTAWDVGTLIVRKPWPGSKNTVCE